MVALVVLFGTGTPAREHRCPDRWYVNGVRPNGRYECRPVLGRYWEDLDDARRQVQIPDDRKIVDWIWCWRPTTPRQDGRRVWCE